MTEKSEISETTSSVICNPISEPSSLPSTTKNDSLDRLYLKIEPSDVLLPTVEVTSDGNQTLNNLDFRLEQTFLAFAEKLSQAVPRENVLLSPGDLLGHSGNSNNNSSDIWGKPYEKNSRLPFHSSFETILSFGTTFLQKPISRPIHRINGSSSATEQQQFSQQLFNSKFSHLNLDGPLKLQTDKGIKVFGHQIFSQKHNLQSDNNKAGFNVGQQQDKRLRLGDDLLKLAKSLLVPKANRRTLISKYGKPIGRPPKHQQRYHRQHSGYLVVPASVVNKNRQIQRQMRSDDRNRQPLENGKRSLQSLSSTLSTRKRPKQQYYNEEEEEDDDEQYGDLFSGYRHMKTGRRNQFVGPSGATRHEDSGYSNGKEDRSRRFPLRKRRKAVYRDEEDGELNENGENMMAEGEDEDLGEIVETSKVIASTRAQQKRLTEIIRRPNTRISSSNNDNHIDGRQKQRQQVQKRQQQQQTQQRRRLRKPASQNSSSITNRRRLLLYGNEDYNDDRDLNEQGSMEEDNEAEDDDEVTQLRQQQQEEESEDPNAPCINTENFRFTSNGLNVLSDTLWASEDLYASIELELENQVLNIFKGDLPPMKKLDKLLGSSLITSRVFDSVRKNAKHLLLPPVKWMNNRRKQRCRTNKGWDLYEILCVSGITKCNKKDVESQKKTFKLSSFIADPLLSAPLQKMQLHDKFTMSLAALDNDADMGIEAPSSYSSSADIASALASRPYMLATSLATSALTRSTTKKSKSLVNKEISFNDANEDCKLIFNSMRQQGLNACRNRFQQKIKR